MDRLIASWPFEPDGDLRVCKPQGVAYQADMQVPSGLYDAAYFDKLRSYESSAIGFRLNVGRVAMLARHAYDGASVLDYGAGAGTFVKAARSWGFAAMGYDINPCTVKALREIDAFSENVEGADVVTFWDSLEHIPEPAEVLARVRINAAVLVAVPIFRDWTKVRESRHYRPGEHLYYWTPAGLEHWMEHQGFQLVEDSDHEIRAGREQIGAYAFRKIGGAL